MSCDAAVVMAVSLVQQQDAREEWDGLTVLLLSTAVVCRVQQMLHLRFWMYLVIWMKFRYVSVMRSTEK